MIIRYETIKVSDHWTSLVDQDAKWLAEDPADENRIEQYGGKLENNLYSLMVVTMGYYLNDEVSRASANARAHVDKARIYFLGDWRTRVPGRDAGYWARGGGLWVTEFRSSIAFAAALDDWESIKKLSEFPRDSSNDLSPCRKDSAWYLLLAEYLLNGESKIYVQRLGKIRSGKAKGHKVFAKTLNAIARNNAVVLEDCFPGNFCTEK